MNHRRFTLHNRMLLYFAVLALALLAASTMQYFMTIDSAERSATKFSNQIIGRIASEMEELLIDYNNISLIISEEPAILQVLNEPLSSHSSEKLATNYDIDSRLYYMTTYIKQLNGIYLIGENGGKYKSNYMTFKEEDLTQTDWYKEIVAVNRTVWFGNHNESFAANSSGKSMISMGAPVKDVNTGKVLGVVVVDIEESVLSELINNEIGSEGIIFVLDEWGEIVSHPDRELVGTVFKLDEGGTELEGYGATSYSTHGDDESIIVHKSLNINGWRVVASLPKSQMTEDIDNLRAWMIGSYIFVALIALFTFYNISGHVVDPVRQMMQKMKEVEKGDLETRMPVDRNDELGDLSHSFNHMIYKVDGLMTTVYEEQKNLRKAELKALQSQINPHFLYNTLSMVIWMARAGENDKVVKIVTAITKYYRIGISRGRDIISLLEEVDHMTNYLYIMYYQYDDQFDYSIDIPEELYQYSTLKLILQPIVENAIYHGVRKSRSKGRIDIAATDTGDELVFEVKDTGEGMSPERLEKLTEVINDFSGAHPESYGLRNVNERLKIFFGQQYGIEIMSQESIGTTVFVRVPKLTEG